MRLRAIFGAATLTMLAFAASAQEKPELRIGSVLSLTGPASSLGIPARNALTLIEEQTAADTSTPFRVKFVTYDDASDPTKAVNAVRKLIGEDRAHLVICCSTTPSSMAILETVTQARVPNISLALAASVIEPAAERKWIFKTPATDRLQVSAVLDDFTKRGGKKIAFMGLEDSFGEGGWRALESLAKERNIEIVAAERFSRNDTNFPPQALRVKQANPDAVYFHAIPQSSVLSEIALRRVGYKGPVYQSGGSANTAYLSLGKETVEGSLVGTTAVLIYEDLPDDHPLKKSIAAFAKSYEKRFNVERIDIFPGQAWDAVGLTLQAARKVLAAGVKFEDVDATRAALRDALETTRGYVGVVGLFDFSPTDHLGLDARSTFLADVKQGRFRLHTAP